MECGPWRLDTRTPLSSPKPRFGNCVHSGRAIHDEVWREREGITRARVQFYIPLFYNIVLGNVKEKTGLSDHRGDSSVCFHRSIPLRSIL